MAVYMLSQDGLDSTDVFKLQMQVEMAKKIMFDKQQEQVTEEGGSRKNNRRETWCPGRSGWAPPFAGGKSCRDSQRQSIAH